MKKLVLVALLLCGVTATSFAQLVQSTTTVTERTYGKQKKELGKIRYQGELNLGFATGGKVKGTDAEGFQGEFETNFSRPFIETIHGVRVGDYLFAGLGLGLQYAYGDMVTGSGTADLDPVDFPAWGTALMPIFVNLKGYYPVSDNFAPYLSLSLGASAVLASDLNMSYSYVEAKLKGGFYCDFGVGINYKKLNFGLGLMHQAIKYTGEYSSYGTEAEAAKMKVTSFYVKVGLKF